MDYVKRFKHLSDHFQQLSEMADLDEHVDSHLIPVMQNAGESFFNCAQNNRLGPFKTPKWFRQTPEINMRNRSLKVRLNEHSLSKNNPSKIVVWESYWLYIITSLAQQDKRNTGIIMAGSLGKQIGPPKQWSYLKHLLIEEFHALEQLVHQRGWQEIAKASEEACIYLADLVHDAQLAKYPKLEYDKLRIRALDGNWYGLTGSQSTLLRSLFVAKGAWVIGKNTGVSRADKTLKTLPDAVQALVQTSRDGYRISSLLQT